MTTKVMPTSFWVGIETEDGKEITGDPLYKRQYTDLGKPLTWQVARGWGRIKYVNIYLRELDKEPIYKKSIHHSNISICNGDTFYFCMHDWNLEGPAKVTVDWSIPSSWLV